MRLIDADALEREYQERYKLFTWDDGEREKATLARVIQMLHAQPTIEERKTGHWTLHKNGLILKDIWGTCSVCGDTLRFENVNAGCGDANYCPSCGAKMEDNT